MKIAEGKPFLSAAMRDRVTTTAGTESPVTWGTVPNRTFRERWQEVVDRTLIEWGRNPDQHEDEGVEPPSRETIQKAISLAEVCRDMGFPPPDTVLPDSSGGIVFECRDGNRIAKFHVWDDGSIEYQRFDGVRLVERARTSASAIA